MRDVDKTKAQLVEELLRLRGRVEQLEGGGGHGRTTGSYLAGNEGRFKIIFDTAYEGIWVFDENYITTFVNRRMADMLQCTQEDLIGKKYSDYWHEDDLSHLEQRMENRRKGLSEHYEWGFQRGDGSLLWAHVSATPIIDENGVFQGSFAMFTDITARKQAEEALLASEAKYRSIFENAVEGIFQSTPDGRLITVNPAMARIFGYTSPEEMVYCVTNIGRQLYGDSADRFTFQELLEKHGIAERFEARFYRKDGSKLWGSLNVRAVKNDGDQVLFYEGALVDITARKQAEEALRASEAKYRNIFENAVEGIFQVTPDGKYLSVNPALARIHGYDSPGDVIDSVTDLAHQLYIDPGRRAELMRVIREEGFAKNFETIMRRKDGSLHWVSINSYAIRDDDGAILYYEGTLQDITTRKFAEEELKGTRRTLNSFIESVSAALEIRDPGTSGHQGRVAGLAGAIASTMGLSDEMTEHIRIAGLLHDIGKLFIPAEILSKPAVLSKAEHVLVQSHPQIGEDMLKDTTLPRTVMEVILQHHERLNGSGYPQGLKGNKISLEARIVAVADVVEAMSFSRPYRPARGVATALDEIRKHRGTLFDANVVDVCLKLFQENLFRFE